MAELILYAIPAFVLLLVVELLSFKYARAIAHDVRHADSWRARFGYLFRGPGWSPDGSGGGTRG
ncbi:MAG TPA: hypothetical protein VF125_00430 [Solirubrobacterales bacterium]